MEPTTDEMQDEEFEKKLQNLQCPFTWEMDDVDSSIKTDYKPHDDEENLPLLKLMRVIMSVYVSTEENEDSDHILELLEDCDAIMTEINDQAEFFTNTIYHVLQATKCHVFWKLNQKIRAKKLLPSITSIDFDNKIERSIINACRSIAWSKYHLLGSEEAVNYIRKALKDNPNCGLWYFILGKNLRRLRRDSSCGAKPSTEEKVAFLKAYEISQNIIYKLFVAQMYRENREFNQAYIVYRQVFSQAIKMDNLNMFLRLALGFIQLRKFQEAKICLDRVEAKAPNDIMFLHYLGFYHKKRKNYKEAAVYLKKAAELDNYPAAKDYLFCIIKVDDSFDRIKYLLSLIDKYKNLPEQHIQNLLLDTAFSYYQIGDLKASLKYFIMAVDINPKSKALTEYYSVLLVDQGINVYERLYRDIFPKIEKVLDSLDETSVDTYKELKSYCEEYKNSIEKKLLDIKI